MKIKIIAVLSAAAVFAGCSPSGERMNEPSGAERPAYESPNGTTNTPTPTNDTGTTGVKTNGANSSSGAATTP